MRRPGSDSLMVNNTLTMIYILGRYPPSLLTTMEPGKKPHREGVFIEIHGQSSASGSKTEERWPAEILPSALNHQVAGYGGIDLPASVFHKGQCTPIRCQALLDLGQNERGRRVIPAGQSGNMRQARKTASDIENSLSAQKVILFFILSGSALVHTGDKFPHIRDSI